MTLTYSCFSIYHFSVTQTWSLPPLWRGMWRQVRPQMHVSGMCLHVELHSHHLCSLQQYRRSGGGDTPFFFNERNATDGKAKSKQFKVMGRKFVYPVWDRTSSWVWTCSMTSPSPCLHFVLTQTQTLLYLQDERYCFTCCKLMFGV